MRPSEIRYARTADGVELAYRVIGDGPVDLLWSFSQLSDVEAAWEYSPIAAFLADLGTFARVVIHDRRGMGRSGGRFGDLDVDVADLMRLLEAAGAPRPFLAGAVIGGAIYAAFAARHPSRVAGLVWHGPVARQARAADYPWGGTADELESYARELAAGWATEPFAASFVAGGAPTMAGDKETIDFFVRWMRATYDAPTAAEYARAWNAVDVRPLLPSIAAPTLVINRGVEPDEGAHIASLIPGSRFLALPGADFMPFIERDQVTAAIREFVDRTKGTAAGRPLVSSQ